MSEAYYIIKDTNKTQADGEILLSSEEIRAKLHQKTAHQINIKPVGVATGTVQPYVKHIGIQDDDYEAGFEPLLDIFGNEVIIDLANAISYVVDGFFYGFKLVPVDVVGSYEYSIVGA